MLIKRFVVLLHLYIYLLWINPNKIYRFICATLVRSEYRMNYKAIETNPNEPADPEPSEKSSSSPSPLRENIIQQEITVSTL